MRTENTHGPDARLIAAWVYRWCPKAQIGGNPFPVSRGCGKAVEKSVEKLLAGYGLFSLTGTGPLLRTLSVHQQVHFRFFYFSYFSFSISYPATYPFPITLIVTKKQLITSEKKCMRHIHSGSPFSARSLSRSSKSSWASRLDFFACPAWDRLALMSSYRF